MLDITAHCLEEVRFFGRNFAKAAFVPSVVLDHHPRYTAAHHLGVPWNGSEEKSVKLIVNVKENERIGGDAAFFDLEAINILVQLGKIVVGKYVGLLSQRQHQRLRLWRGTSRSHGLQSLSQRGNRSAEG